ncbi:MAG: kelch repeat-containing protein [Sedimentisphaerales bacterium]
MNMQSILKIVVVSGLIGMTSVSLAAEGSWTRKADMPTARTGLSACVVDGKIYAIGGGSGIHGGAFSTVEEFDPATDTWLKKADIPSRRYFHSSSMVNGKIYVIGGATGQKITTSNVEEYDPMTDTWSRKANMPTARCFLSTSVVNGKIYAIGGRLYPEHSNVPIVEEYDPATDTWTRKADMLTTRCFLSTSTVEGKIYAIGGIVGPMGSAANAIVEEYNPATDTWTRKTDMPTPRCMFSTSVLAGRIYAIGGDTGMGSVFSAVEEYNPSMDIWAMRSDMPTARGSLSTSEVNGKIYAIGGGVSADVPVSTVEEYEIIPPPPDFNGDGIVDIKDLLRLIESWSQNDPTVDIAPTFGDGIVDALDLELLMSYWEQPIDDPTLIAHWALDEAEGAITYDSAGINDAFVVGGASWQPGSGQVDGALQLNGIDGCAIAGPVLNPADGPFSLLAWVNGGALGQVVVSQQGAANWLAADAEGNLMTELKGTGRSAGPLFSETVITDGQWHCIGFVWDGTKRILYVDDVEAAEDTQVNLQGSDGGLYIGTGKAMESGTYWSGLIDDVRIYNRAVSP